ncbi:MAG: EVE domain-containing protein [Chitinophagales bacterium]|nr:EVE domain-containing protein [Chitinophagales bacterium]
MKYWLIKSDPDTYGWDEMKKDKKTFWDGVRNYAARNHMKDMKKGDLCLFYHSQLKPPHITGVVEVVKEHYQDPTTEDDRWVAVDVKYKRSFKNLVTLDDIKQRKGLANMVLLRISRLSVQPVKKTEFDTIVKMGS